MANRNIRKVIEQLLEVIPPSETELIKDIGFVTYNAGFRAPELMYLLWRDLAEVLNAHYRETDWYLKLVDIFNGPKESNEKEDPHPNA